MVYGAMAYMAHRRQARHTGRIRVLVTYHHHMTATRSNWSGLAETSLVHAFLHCSVSISEPLQPNVVLDIHST